MFTFRLAGHSFAMLSSYEPPATSRSGPPFASATTTLVTRLHVNQNQHHPMTSERHLLEPFHRAQQSCTVVISSIANVEALVCRFMGRSCQRRYVRKRCRQTRRRCDIYFCIRIQLEEAFRAVICCAETLWKLVSVPRQFEWLTIGNPAEIPHPESRSLVADARCDLHLPPFLGMDQTLPSAVQIRWEGSPGPPAPTDLLEKTFQILRFAGLYRYCYHRVPLLSNVHSVTTPIFFPIAVSLIPSYNFQNAALRARGR